MQSLEKEFPDDYDKPLGSGTTMKRRTFLGIMGASIALASAACRRPEEKIMAYVNKPEYMTPGLANHFATATSQGNFATGLLVKTREGRPIKVEGNNLDPISNGASSVQAQSLLLSLYDPDRIIRPTVNNSDSTPQNAINRMVDAIKEVTEKGKSVRILVDEHASPSLAKLYSDIETVLPDTKVVTMPALPMAGAAEANAALLGIDGVFVPDLSKAKTILGIDADFLGSDSEAVYHIRNFAQNRKPSTKNPEMSRYYAVESGMTLSGTNADYRVRIKPQEMNEFLLALLHEIVVKRGVSSLADSGIASKLRNHGNTNFAFLTRIADDLLSQQGVVMIGKHLPAETHALGILLNYAVGAYGEQKPINPSHVLPYSEAKSNAAEAVKQELTAGDVGVVIFADVNPAYSLGPDVFKKLTSKVLYKFEFGLYADETSKSCPIFVPINHPLEHWGDMQMLDGSMAIQQPLIAPLNDGQLSLPDALLLLAKAYNPEFEKDTAKYYDYVRNYWRQNVYEPLSGKTFGTFWNEALQSGRVERSITSRTIAWNSQAAGSMIDRASKTESGAMMCGVLPHAYLKDGKFANLGWLQELPDPVTTVVWDNVAMMSKKTAEKNSLRQGDLIRVKSKRGTIELPVFYQPGMADDVVITTSGYGRTEGGRVLDGVGANTALLTPEGKHNLGYFPVTIEPTGETYEIATTQNNHSLGGEEFFGIDRENIVKDATLEEFLNDPGVIHEGDLPVYGVEEPLDEPISLVPEHDYSTGHRWAMTIDESACVGCNACTIACQSENNIPTVGKEQVIKGREMHWIRMDRYYVGDEENPEVARQTMLCQHCETAPCEVVCPVAATTHSPEGLNEMTYNRCVGTRYCSNNCPYKVRRFNYLDYHDEDRDPLSMLFNPDVTVRMRGVMEKCTFCVQRINEAKYHAKNEGRETLKDGEVQTACQQSCPAEAITFGNVNDPESNVSKSRSSERGYLVLRDLNTRPMVTYLAKIRNTAGGAA